MSPELHGHDAGLLADLSRLIAQGLQRRRLLGLLAGTSALSLAGCGGGSNNSSATGTTSTTTTSTPVADCTVIPEETAGPFPGDGTNTSNGRVANALTLSGIVRSDIRSSIAGATGVAQGVLLTVRLRLVNSSCADLANYAVYLWHCDREGRYSMYSTGVTAENYLRGVQAATSDGTVAFTSIFPGCYSGRMPHIHFEVYRSVAAAATASNKIKTSQLALPVNVCQAVYNNSSGYSASIANLAQISFQTDNVFSDGVTRQLATMTGDLASGYVATLNVGVAA